MNCPPRTKGRPTAPRVARGRCGAWPGPLPECPPCGARARPKRRRRRRALRPQCRPPRPVGSVRPATPAAAAAASSSCGGRHVPPPARAPATPTPGHAHGPPHAPPGAAVDPSAARAASFRLAPRPPVLPRKVAAASQRSPKRSNRVVPWVCHQTAWGTSKDYLPARRRTWTGVHSIHDASGKGP